VTSIDNVLGQDFERRGKALRWDGQSFVRNRQRELENTADTLVGVFPGMVDSVRVRSRVLGNEASVWADRLVEDTRCFPAELWYDLKLLE
jgi:hypothetical protein